MTLMLGRVGQTIPTPHGSLEYNDIGVEGARALAAVLPLCTSLQTLEYVDAIA